MFVWKAVCVSFGHILTNKGISKNSEKLRRIQEYPRLQNQSEFNAFLAMQRFICLLKILRKSLSH